MIIDGPGVPDFEPDVTGCGFVFLRFEFLYSLGHWRLFRPRTEDEVRRRRVEREHFLRVPFPFHHIVSLPPPPSLYQFSMVYPQTTSPRSALNTVVDPCWHS